MEKFIQYLRQTFAEVKSKLPNDKQSKVSTLREKALNLIISEGLPNSKDELWRHFPIEKQISSSYDIQLDADPYQPVERLFEF